MFLFSAKCLPQNLPASLHIQALPPAPPKVPCRSQPPPLPQPGHRHPPCRSPPPPLSSTSNGPQHLIISFFLGISTFSGYQISKILKSLFNFSLNEPQTTLDYLLDKTENLTEAERKSMDSKRRAIQRFKDSQIQKFKDSKIHRFTDSNCETTAIQAQIVISLPSTQESIDYPMPDFLTPISDSLVMGTTS